jgi:uncharacterized protein with HEPN domain
MKPRDPSYLLDMLVAARRILKFVGDADLQRMMTDDLLHSAVCRQLQIIGDAARRISDETRTANPQIEWQQIIGMRNILIHAYDRVDDTELWRVATRDLPRLAGEIEKLLRESPE